MFAALKERFFGAAGSKGRAKSRLHFVLVQDRTGLTNEEMSSFKEELIEVIERYFLIDKDGFDIAYEREDDETMLLINSPVVVRRNGSGETENKKIRGSRKKRKEAREVSAQAG